MLKTILMKKLSEIKTLKFTKNTDIKYDIFYKLLVIFFINRISSGVNVK